MELKEKILGVTSGLHIGAVATVDEGRPAVRFMALDGQDDLTLVGATMQGSRKVLQITKNPEVAIAIWSGREYTDPYVVIRATARVHTDAATKRRYWDELKAQYFGSPDNPEYVVVTFIPARIEYYETQGSVQVWERGQQIPISA